MNSQLRKINKEQGSKAEKWRLPVMDGSSTSVFTDEKKSKREEKKAKEEESTAIPTAEEIEQWHQQARAEGHQQGYQEGLAKAQQELQQKGAQLQQLINFFEHPLQALNEEIEQQLNQLVVSLAQQLVRREIKAEPGEIIGLIRECVQQLPAGTRKIRIMLNPEDAELVRSTLQLDKNEDEQSWTLIEDPMITRGGCEIKAGKSVINATLDNRLQALAASVFGGERQEDQVDDDAD